MPRIRPDCLDFERFDDFVGFNFWLREEPDEEDDEEEDEGGNKTEPDDEEEDDQEEDGYSE